MERSINALRALCDSVVGSNHETEVGFKRILSQVDWSGPQRAAKPQDLPLVEKYFKQTVDMGGDNPMGDLGRALYADAEQLEWFTMYHSYEEDKRLADLHKNYVIARIAGPGGSWFAEDLTTAITIQGPNTFYPQHAHRQREVYGVIGGNAEWQRGAEPWVVRPSGDLIYHSSGLRHALQTREEPLLAFASWIDHVKETPAFIWA